MDLSLTLTEHLNHFIELIGGCGEENPSLVRRLDVLILKHLDG